MQAIWNQAASKRGREVKPRDILMMTQREWTHNSKYDIYRIVTRYGSFRIRIRNYYLSQNADEVVVLTDKPQKPLPIDWTTLEPQAEPVAEEPPQTAPESPAVPVPAGMLF